MNNSQLINKAQGVAGCLSYNDAPEGDAKRMLLELCHRLGQRTITIGKNKEGYYWTSVFGQFQYFTLRETIMWRLFSVPPIGKELLREVKP